MYTYNVFNSDRTFTNLFDSNIDVSKKYIYQ